MPKPAPATDTPRLRAGDVLTLRTGPVVFGGACLAHLDDGRVAFVAFAAPGELVEAEVERVHSDYVEVRTMTVLETSPDRVSPRCPLFGDCGGCQLQHLAYSAQAAANGDTLGNRISALAPDFALVVGVPHAIPAEYTRGI